MVAGSGGVHLPRQRVDMARRGLGVDVVHCALDSRRVEALLGSMVAPRTMAMRISALEIYEPVVDGSLLMAVTASASEARA
jgi:hypothetical protein